MVENNMNMEELSYLKKEIDTESIMTKIDMKGIITNIMESPR